MSTHLIEEDTCGKYLPDLNVRGKGRALPRNAARLGRARPDCAAACTASSSLLSARFRARFRARIFGRTRIIISGDRHAVERVSAPDPTAASINKVVLQLLRGLWDLAQKLPPQHDGRR